MEKRVAQCPFLKQACIRERCQLFLDIPVVQGSPLVGRAKAAAIRGCAFNLAVHFLGQLTMISQVGPGPRGPAAG